jgi:putative transposase
VVTKKGVRVANGHYDAAEFGGLEGARVKVLFDEADAGGVWVFGEDGAFLCRAVDPELLGVSRAELAERRKAHQNAVLGAGMADLKKMANEARPQDLVADILRDKAEKAGKVVSISSRATTPHGTPALTAASAAASGKRPPKPELTEAQAAKREALVVEFARQAEPAPDAKTIRLERAARIEALIAAGEEVPPADLNFLAGYRTTPEYRAAQRLAAAS